MSHARDPDNAAEVKPKAKPGVRPKLLVVIDGPAGAGKSTIARALAHELEICVLDTGALYRVSALAARRRGIDWQDGDAVASLIPELEIKFLPPIAGSSAQRVQLDQEDVSAEIRSPEISEGASIVSAHAAVRAALLQLQRDLSAGGCVAEGRDMGTVVFPGAQHKFFLTASIDSRSQRRYAELLSHWEQGRGSDRPQLDQVRRDMLQRDERDSGRDVAPLRPAADAHVIDSSELDEAAVLGLILGKIRERS